MIRKIREILPDQKFTFKYNFKLSGLNMVAYLNCIHSSNDKAKDKVKVRCVAEKFRPIGEDVEFEVEIACNECNCSLKTKGTGKIRVIMA